MFSGHNTPTLLYSITPVFATRNQQSLAQTGHTVSAAYLILLIIKTVLQCLNQRQGGPKSTMGKGAELWQV
jgi:hypothetical protein